MKKSNMKSKEQPLNTHIPEYMNLLRSGIDIGGRLNRRNKDGILLAATALASLDADVANSIIGSWEKRDSDFHKALRGDYNKVIGKQSSQATKYMRQQSSVNQPYIALFYAFVLCEVSTDNFYNFVKSCCSLVSRNYPRADIEKFIKNSEILKPIEKFMSSSKDQYLPVFIPTSKRVVHFMASMFGCIYPDDSLNDWLDRKSSVRPPPCTYYINNLSGDSPIGMDLAALMWLVRKKSTEDEEESTYMATWLYNTIVVGHKGIFDDVFAVKGNLSSVIFYTDED